MGVVTTADEKRDEAKECLDRAFKLLLEVTDPNTWGSSDYREDYKDTLDEVALEIKKLKRKI